MAQGPDPSSNFELTNNKTFQDHFFSQLPALREGKLCNETLRVGTNTIKCNKLILATHFGFFLDHYLQTDSRQESKDYTRSLDIDYEALKLVVDYCYTGNLKFNMEKARDVMKVLYYLKFTNPGPVKAISRYITKNMTTMDSIGWYIFAMNYENMEEVKTHARKLMKSMDMKTVADSSDFLELDISAMMFIIESVMKKKRRDDDDSALIAAAKWSMHMPLKRKADFNKLVQLIDLKLCSQDVLKQVYKKYGKDLLTESLLHKFREHIAEVDSPSPTVSASPAPKRPSPTPLPYPFKKQTKEKGQSTTPLPDQPTMRIKEEPISATPIAIPSASRPALVKVSLSVYDLQRPSLTLNEPSEQIPKVSSTKPQPSSPSSISASPMANLHAPGPEQAPQQSPQPQKSEQKVLVIAGRDRNNVSTAIWLLGLKSGQHTMRARLPSPTYSGTVCAAPEGAICAEVDTKTAQTKKIIMYRKATDDWVELPPHSEKTSAISMLCIGRKLFVHGGVRKISRTLTCLDLDTLQWSTCRDMPQGAHKPVLGCCGNFLYVIFKPEGGSGRCIMLCYDMVSGTWTSKGELPAEILEVSGTQAVTLKGCLYLIGGSNNICVRYDQQTKVWQFMNRSNFNHNKGAAWVCREKIFLSGGDLPSNVIEMYDPNNDKWIKKRISLPQAIYSHCVILL